MSSSSSSGQVGMWGMQDGEEQMIDDAEQRGKSADKVAQKDSFGRRKSVRLTHESHSKWLLRAVALVCILSLPAFLFGVLFTSVGWGVTVITELRKFYEKARAVGYAGFGILFILYLLDGSYWRGCWRLLRVVLTMCAVCLIGIGGILMAREYAALPMLVFLMVVPLYVYVWRIAVWRRTDIYYFMSSLALALFVVAWAGLLSWVGIALGNDEMWPGTNSTTKIRFYNRLKCKFDVILKDGIVDDVVEPAGEEACATAAFLLYIGLMIASGAVLIFSFVTHFIAKSLRRKSPRSQLRVFSMLAGMTLLGMWVATEIAGTTPQISNLVMLFSVAGIFCLVFLMGATIGWSSLRTSIKKVPIIASLSKSLASDWLKAMGMFMMPFYLMFMCLSAVNQFFRLYLTPCAYQLKEGERKTFLTAAVHKQYSLIKKWPWTDVFKKVGFLGIFYFVFWVGVGKVTYVFLSWLNGALASLGFGPTVAIFYATGLTMFLLPPVPGVPVYILGGVVLTKATQRFIDGESGTSSSVASTPLSPSSSSSLEAATEPSQGSFFLACAFVTLICYCIKLNAVAMQQKLIGGLMSNSLYVRKTVMVNSVTIKAIRQILTRPGMRLDKVAILCGGPDWPTSVLTGILKLSVFKMLFGSLPVILLVWPCVMSGAFLLPPPDTKPATKQLYDGLGSVFMMAATGVQSLAFFAAAYYIEEYASKNSSKLKRMPNDAEVERAELRDSTKKEVMSKIARWDRVPLLHKINLIVMYLECLAYCLAFGGAGSLIFEEFDLTHTIEGKLNGNALNLVKGTVGWVLIGLVFMTWVHLKIFACWSEGQYKKFTNANGGPQHLEMISNAKVAPASHSTSGNSGTSAGDNDSCRQS